MVEWQDWYSYRWLTCNTVPKFWCTFQPWGDIITAAVFGTIILWITSAHMHTQVLIYCLSLFFCFFCLTRTPIYTHPKCDGIYCLPHAPATAPCGVEDWTMHNCVALGHSWLCSQMQRSTPDHTQRRSWVWSAVWQTWTFQPVEVSAIILTPYVI